MQKYYISTFLFTLISGILFILVSFAIPYHLLKIGCAATTVSVAFLCTLPYSFKLLVAPIIDKYSIPYLSSRLSHRHAWALLIQIGLALSSLVLLIVDFQRDGLLIAIDMFVISLLTSFYDVIIDAYRIEQAPSQRELAQATVWSTSGFRIGMLISSAGGLYLSSMIGWYHVYLYTFCILLCAPLVTLWSNDNTLKKTQLDKNLVSFREYLKVIYESYQYLKSNHKNFGWIVLFIFLYKISCTVPMVTSSKLFIDLSYSSEEIALIFKTYGLVIMILGGIAGAFITKRVGIFKNILICGIIELITPLMYTFLPLIGYSMKYFFITTTLQNFASGIAGTALITYTGSLCKKDKLVGTQFALFSSLGSLTRIILSSVSMLAIAYIPYSQFYILTALVSALIIPVWFLIRKEEVGELKGR